ncbi:MAG TPA: GIY-YIG nuclease family protein [Thermoanaerobaculia bacterium]
MPFVYILRCRDGSFYTGATKNLPQRLASHAAGKASRYTRSRLPIELAWSAEIATWVEALAEERRIKGMTRARKLALIAAGATGPPAGRAGRGGRTSPARGPSAGSPRGSRRRGSKAAR